MPEWAPWALWWALLRCGAFGVQNRDPDGLRPLRTARPAMGPDIRTLNVASVAPARVDGSDRSPWFAEEDVETRQAVCAVNVLRLPRWGGVPASRGARLSRLRQL